MNYISTFLYVNILIKTIFLCLGILDTYKLFWYYFEMKIIPIIFSIVFTIALKLFQLINHSLYQTNGGILCLAQWRGRIICLQARPSKPTRRSDSPLGDATAPCLPLETPSRRSHFSFTLSAMFAFSFVQTYALHYCIYTRPFNFLCFPIRR